MNNFYKNIRRIREAKEYSQEYVAGKLKISQRNYSKMENGEIDISVNKLFQICEALEVEVTDVLGVDGKHVYNNVVSTQKGNGFVINQAEKNVELYERLLSEKNLLLEEKNARIKILEKVLNKGKE